MARHHPNPISEAMAQGTPVPTDLLGDLTDCTSQVDQANILRQRLAEDGYLFLRGVVPRDQAMAARQEVFQRLSEVGEIQEPALSGIATGTSHRKTRCKDLGSFWQSVCTGAALREATHGAQMEATMSMLLDEPATAHDFLFLRPGRPGVSTRLHYDFPFFARGSQRIYTAWLALGDITIREGPLMIAEGSNAFEDLIEPIRKIDYESSSSPNVQIMEDTVKFIRNRHSRFLTGDFRAGDLIVFDMFTLHGTFDNCSPDNRVRLSCDVRWQPTSDPVDPRYRGDHPAGTTGAGYGELNGAKPLTEDWHAR
ncbi:MAG: phytanoyl-CoA dioxygenase family protein [Pirellulaceae bacterium]|nr:phytanoyl-CoA dioxygenase family protein [Pirellulaceae bacterium]